MVWKVCVIFLSLYIGAPSLCRAVGRDPADHHQDAGFHFACSSHPNVSSITLYTEETVEQLQETFSNFVESGDNDNAKAVIFWLDFQKYEGVNPMLYNLTHYYGLWTWTWVYDEYGKTLLRFSIQAEYLSFGLLHRNVETMHIKFDNRTNVSDIAHLPESCKFDLGVNFLAKIINVQDIQGKDKDNCLCSRYSEFTSFSGYNVISSKCCCYVQSQLVENMTDCNIETITDTAWITSSKIMLYIFVFILEYLTWSSLHWRLLFPKNHTVLANFKTPCQTVVKINQTELIDCSEKSTVSIIELVSFMKPVQDCAKLISSCFETLKKGPRSCRISVWRLVCTSFVSIVLIPLGLWIPFIARLAYPKSRKEEIHTWEQFNDRYITEDNDMVLPPDIILISFAMAIILRIGFDIVWYEHSLQCIAHSFPCKAPGEENGETTESVAPLNAKEKPGEKNGGTTESVALLKAKGTPGEESGRTMKSSETTCIMTNMKKLSSLFNFQDEDVNKIYKKFRPSDETDDHIYDNMHSLAAKLHIQMFRKGIITCSHWFCLFALPLFGLYLVTSIVFYLVLPFPLIYNLFQKISSKGSQSPLNLKSIGFATLVFITHFQVVCITFTFINLSIFGAFLLAGVALNIEFMAQPIVFFVTLFIYVFTEYKNVTKYYQDLKIATYNKCTQFTHTNDANSNKQQHPDDANSNKQQHPDDANSNKQQHPDDANANKQQHPDDANSNKQQHPDDVNSNKQQHPDDANSDKQQHPDDANSNKQQHPDDANSNKQPKELTNCWADFDKHEKCGKVTNVKKDSNKILIFKGVPFVESLRWQDCISRKLFSYICEKVSPIPNKLVSIMLRLIAATSFLLLIFCVVKSFGQNPLKSSVLAFTMGIIPVFEQYRKKRKGNDFEEDQKAKEIDLAVKGYLKLSDPDDNNKETCQSEGCCTCFISLSENNTSHNSDDNGNGQSQYMALDTIESNKG